MFQELIMPAFGALVLVAWTGSGAWALRPAATNRALAKALAGPADPTSDEDPHDTHTPSGQQGQAQSSAAARVTRGLTRNGLLGVLVMIATAFLFIHVFFELAGWLQLAWVLAAIGAAYSTWRVTLLWPNRHVEQQHRDRLTAHGFQIVRPPWAMIFVAAALVAIWFLPPLILY